MALLCLNFKTMAQENKAVDVTAKGIQIGQKVPEVTITGLHNYKDKNGKSATNAKLSDFKGKLLILDFWATWCSPCIAMIPKMDSLQKQFGDKIQFLSVTYQTENEVLPFLEKFEKQQKRHFDLSVVTSSKALHQLFPHITLPHYVWIDGNGILRAITEYKEVNAVNISKSIASSIEFVQKKDMKIAYDNKKPFLIDGNGGDGKNLIYHSLLTDFTEGLGPEYNYTPIQENVLRSISAKNLNLIQLFRYANGGDRNYFANNKTIVAVKDKAKLEFKGKGIHYLNWLKDHNGYCYELIVPSTMSKNIFQLMRDDLDKLFPQYKARIEKMKVKCLVLRRTSDIDKLSSNGEMPVREISGFRFKIINGSLNSLITRLNVLYMQNSQYPIVNGTGYAGNVNMDLKARLSNLSEVNSELKKYDLQFVEEDYETEMLVIRDNFAQIDEKQEFKTGNTSYHE